MSPKSESTTLTTVDSSRLMPSAWEERFEDEINQLFDEAIERLPRFVDRHFRSLTKVMQRNLSPKTGLGDLVVGLRNIASGVSTAVGGPDFTTTTFTGDEIAKAFEAEVLSSFELEALLTRLFDEFEADLWERFEAENVRNVPDVLSFRDHLQVMINEEIAHDPGLAQAVRSGIHIGIPATLGYFLFGKFDFAGLQKGVPAMGSHEVSFLQRFFGALRGKTPEVGEEDSFFHSVTGQALGITGSILGSLVIGGILEYAVNSVRDMKGIYIRQLNTARYVLLYGADPSNRNGRGILHIIRAIERKFEQLPGYASEAFNVWLNAKRTNNATILDDVSFFSSDVHGDVTIEEVLDVVEDVREVVEDVAESNDVISVDKPESDSESSEEDEESVGGSSDKSAQKSSDQASQRANSNRSKNQRRRKK